MISLVMLSALLVVVGCANKHDKVEAGVSLELAQQRAEVLSQINYQLSFEVPLDAKADIKGHIIIAFELTDTTTPLLLDFRESADKIKRVVSNGTASRYRFSNEHIVLPRAELKPGRNQIEIDFRVDQGALNRNPEYLYTLFVPDRARTAFPLFDQPDLKATYELSLKVPAAWRAMSNAPLETTEKFGGETEYRFGRTDMISSYLFSFVAGEFETVTREIGGRSMTMLHRETDPAKLARNLDTIFELHAASLDWMEEYTGIAYPFQKFDFALIPTFQYGGMEHVGAIQYRASSLLLDETPSDTQLLNRASLIAHETAHMWFGDLVTMRWFNDVWTKEVFANFMAAKIVNPGFPEINHQLNFLVDLYPRAYSVDRTPGANPIRQQLGNLNQAGQMYGAIIYNKAPIMMRQLEALLGQDLFREGLQEYLRAYAHGNATWPDLIAILDKKSETDLQRWSEVWVNTAGRPQFAQSGGPETGASVLRQVDISGQQRVWPQQFEVAAFSAQQRRVLSVLSVDAQGTLAVAEASPSQRLVFNADGFGYGLFPAELDDLQLWGRLDLVSKGSLLINLYEQFLNGSGPAPVAYLQALQSLLVEERNQLLLDLVLGQMQRVYWSFLAPSERLAVAVTLEQQLWQNLVSDGDSRRKKIWFDAYASIAVSGPALERVRSLWVGSLSIEGLTLSDDDRIALMQLLALKLPGQADQLVTQQLSATSNSDKRRMIEFLAPSLSANQDVRDAFFASLGSAENRQIERWVLAALENLHHPLRTSVSEQYLLASLDWLEDIQVTGDIFFPKGWLDASFANYNSDSAVAIAAGFLASHPDYNPQLRMKIQQATDLMNRANRIVSKAEG